MINHNRNECIQENIYITEYIWTYIEPDHFAAHLKLTQLRRSTGLSSDSVGKESTCNAGGAFKYTPMQLYCAHSILVLFKKKKKGRKGKEKKDGFKQVQWESAVGEAIASVHPWWRRVGTSAPGAGVTLPRCVRVEAWSFGSSIRMHVQCVKTLCFV